MTDPCKHGSLSRSCEICERDEEIDRLSEENKAAWDSAEHNAQRARDAEKRIEELEAYRTASGVTFLLDRIEELERMNRFHMEGDKQDGLHVITTEQIDKAWEHHDEFDTESVAVFTELGIVACEECGGSGTVQRIPPHYRAKGPCPSCYRNGKSHGWKVVSDE